MASAASRETDALAESESPSRPRSGSGRAWLRPALLGAVVGAALALAWLWISEVVRHEPTAEIAIVPQPVEGVQADGIRDGPALDVFRDPELRGGFLPGWLNAAFPASTVAQLTDGTGPLRGTWVYAAVSNDEIACIIVRLEVNGMDWNCTSVDRVVSSGMRLRTLVPADLGSGDDDGDGVAGDLTRTDLLAVDWNDDGTFLVTRTPR